MQTMIIYSGGLDSTVLLYSIKPQLAISFDYGQKHFGKEIECAIWNCKHLSIPHEVIDIKLIGCHLKSHLLKGGADIPDGHYEDLIMKQTVVPFRNGIMLSIACGIAESNELNEVAYAAHAGDHAIYPDCRASFVENMKNVMFLGTYNNVRLSCPFINMKKRDVAILGKSLGVDFSHTWSCYKGEEVHCGKCGTCVERKEALNEFDSTIYSD